MGPPHLRLAIMHGRVGNMSFFLESSALTDMPRNARHLLFMSVRSEGSSDPSQGLVGVGRVVVFAILP